MSFRINLNQSVLTTKMTEKSGERKVDKIVLITCHEL